MTDAGLLSVAKHHNRLRSFKVTSAYLLTVAGLYAFLQREPYLEELGTFHWDLEEKLRESENVCPRLFRFNGNSFSRIIAE